MVFPEVVSKSDRLNIANIHLVRAKRLLEEGKLQAASFEFGICAASLELAYDELRQLTQQNAKKSQRNP